jgi:hypothetical protein
MIQKSRSKLNYVFDLELPREVEIEMVYNKDETCVGVDVGNTQQNQFMRRDLGSIKFVRCQGNLLSLGVFNAKSILGEISKVIAQCAAVSVNKTQ